MRLFPPRRVSGLLLLAAFVLSLGGVVLYNAGTAYGWVSRPRPTTPGSGP
jgi:hypothetical protein